MVRAWRTVRGALFGAGLVVLAVGVGVATGAIPSASGVIHACYKTAPGEETLRVIDTEGGHHCKRAKPRLPGINKDPRATPAPRDPRDRKARRGLRARRV